MQTLMPEKRQGCLDHHATITLWLPMLGLKSLESTQGKYSCKAHRVLSLPFNTQKVDRTNLLATSLHQLQRHEPHMLAQRPIALKFRGEEGTGSGVTRDWLTQVQEQIFLRDHPSLNYFDGRCRAPVCRQLDRCISSSEVES
eukprot:1161866-Pelagomonas_calceolata.AAC.9